MHAWCSSLLNLASTFVTVANKAGRQPGWQAGGQADRQASSKEKLQVLKN